QGRWGCQRVVVVVTTHRAELAAQFGEGVAAGVLDRLEDLAGRAVLLVEHARLYAGLDDRRGDLVGDQVVQVTGDTGPFQGYGEADLFLLLALQAAGPVG